MYIFRICSFSIVLLCSASSLLSMNQDNASNAPTQNPNQILPPTVQQQFIDEEFPDVHEFEPANQHPVAQPQNNIPNALHRESLHNWNNRRTSLNAATRLYPNHWPSDDMPPSPPVTLNHEAFQAWLSTATWTPLPGMAPNQDQAAQSQENAADATPQNQQPE